jgi:hypothetical protein
MASCTILFSFRGALIVERKVRHNSAMIPRKIFDIALHPFSIFHLAKKLRGEESGQHSIF